MFVLAHLSDPHLAPLPRPRLLELLSKRGLGYINWLRKRRSIHRADMLAALVADLKDHAPDHVAVSGDLVNLSLTSEFAAARRWLASLGDPHHVTVVPGNHDAYVRPAEKFAERHWAEFMRGDDGEGFPFVRRRGPLALIGVSTAVPTAPLLATGRLGAAQREALDRILNQLSTEAIFRVLLIHHPLRSKSRYKRLTNSAQLLPLLKRHGVDLILHGHDHLHSTTWFDGPHGRIPALGVPSASSLAHGRYPGAAYNLLSIERDGDAWRCEHRVRGIDEALRVVDLERATLL